VHFFFCFEGGFDLREQIEILASLQEIDRQVREKHIIRDSLLAEVQRKEKEIEAKKAEMKLLSDEWAESDKQRREKEQVLQADGQKAVEKRMRMNRIKNIKELQALQREIDQIKQSNSELEEALIQVFEELEGRAAALKAKEEEIKKLEEEWAEKRKELEVQLSGIEEAVAASASARKTIAARLDGNLIARYELIFSRRGGMAVVEVSGGICQGCYMNIPHQLLNEIIKSDRLNLCPSCHRILYYKPAQSNEKHP
jgi:predicted  nucleic acid-binding Zn-ribbon protein